MGGGWGVLKIATLGHQKTLCKHGVFVFYLYRGGGGEALTMPWPESCSCQYLL